jgi:hypothetical protein
LCRTKYGRLSTFDRAVTALRSESAAENRWSLSDGEFEEPPREQFRSYLMAVRVFEGATVDIALKRVFDDVRTFELDLQTLKWLDVVQSTWEEAQDRIALTWTVNGAVITPLECFRLLAYTEDLHCDPEFEARKSATDPLLWQMLRMHGALYANAVANAAIYLRALARDDPATGHWFAPREPGVESAVEWFERNFRR